MASPSSAFQELQESTPLQFSKLPQPCRSASPSACSRLLAGFAAVPAEPLACRGDSSVINGTAHGLATGSSLSAAPRSPRGRARSVVVGRRRPPRPGVRAGRPAALWFVVSGLVPTFQVAVVFGHLRLIFAVWPSQQDPRALQGNIKHQPLSWSAQEIRILSLLHRALCLMGLFSILHLI